MQAAESPSAVKECCRLFFNRSANGLPHCGQAQYPHWYAGPPTNAVANVGFGSTATVGDQAACGGQKRSVALVPKFSTKRTLGRRKIRARIVGGPGLRRSARGGRPPQGQTNRRAT